MTGRTLMEFTRRRQQAHPWDTPPMDVTDVSGQVSWLAGHCLCLAFPVVHTSGMERHRLAVHSCGGSAGLDALWSIAPASLLASEPLATRKTLTFEDLLGAAGKSRMRAHHAQAWNFFPRGAFQLSPASCPSSVPRRGRDSPKPQMRADAEPSRHAQMLQVSVLTAKKCRFHAPRGQDANQRVA